MKSMMMVQAGADPGIAQQMANGMIENIIRQQATIMAFNDVWLLAMFLAMLRFILLMRPPRKRGGATMVH